LSLSISKENINIENKGESKVKAIIFGQTVEILANSTIESKLKVLA
jgi:hypothetical protein